MGSPSHIPYIGSMDIKALYPLVVQEASAMIVEEKILKSEVKFIDVAMRLATLYTMASIKKNQRMLERIERLMQRRRRQNLTNKKLPKLQ